MMKKLNKGQQKVILLGYAAELKKTLDRFFETDNFDVTVFYGSFSALVKIYRKKRYGSGARVFPFKAVKKRSSGAIWLRKPLVDKEWFSPAAFDSIGFVERLCKHEGSGG